MGYVKRLDVKTSLGRRTLPPRPCKNLHPGSIRNFMNRFLLGFVALFLPVCAMAQLRGQDGNGNGDTTSHIRALPNVAYALSIEDIPPTIDGNLDDVAWQSARVITDFVQRDPNDGEPATEATEVRFAFTNRSLYVGFRGFDREPNRVYGRLVRRDQRTAADNFSVFIDSYRDGRTSFEINVNASGSRRDVFIYGDGTGRDDSWDPVYDWAAKIDSLGWTAELRIPFSQLRFPPRDSVVFGVRVRRYIYKTNEEVNWPYIARDQVGEASNYAELTGFGQLPSPRRVELLPYTAATTTFEPDEPGNPFATGRNTAGRVGADMKIGLTTGLTVDATVNPDFGQVEADAAEVNLSDFETFFPEKRPFFIEGTNLFQFSLSPAQRTRFGFSRGGQEGLVYTRRIGRRPQVSADDAGGYADPVNQTTILAAGKLSGQAAGGWAVGLMQAVTQKESARIVDSTGADGRSFVEPLTSYSVFRAQRNAARGRVSYGLLGTAMIRRLDEPAFDWLHEQALSGGADLNVRFGRDRYEMGAAIMGARVRGSQEALIRTQRSSARYFQRPGQTHATLDSARTHLSGYAGHFRVAKVVGFLNWEARYATRSPGFEVNDMGFLRRADVHEQRARVDLRWLRPGTVFRRFEWRFDQQAEFSYGWERTQTQASTRLDMEFLNYWNTNVSVRRSFPALSTRLLRGGPAFEEPGAWNVSWRGRTDFRRPLWFDANLNYDREEFSNAETWRTGVGIRLRPPGSFSLSLQGQTSWRTSDRQYLSANTVADSTYYVLGRLDRRETSITLRVDLALTPRLSFELYAEPFVSSGTYNVLNLVADPRAELYSDRFDPLDADRMTRPGNGEDIDVDVDRNGTTDFTLSDPDFRFVSLRTNAVIRWEFRPGSTLFLVWQQDRNDRFDDGSSDIANSFGDAFTAEGTQVFAVKIAYWLGS